MAGRLPDEIMAELQRTIGRIANKEDHSMEHASIAHAIVDLTNLARPALCGEPSRPFKKNF